MGSWTGMPFGVRPIIMEPETFSKIPASSPKLINEADAGYVLFICIVPGGNRLRGSNRHDAEGG